MAPDPADEKRSIAPQFLNLDLELLSSKNLVALNEYFSTNSCVLYNGPVPQGHQLTVEPLCRDVLCANASECTDQFLDVIAALPSELLEDWKACKRRVFDYGFESGLESAPLMVSLTTGQLQKMAELGLSLRVTIYSFRNDDPEREAFDGMSK